MKWYSASPRKREHESRAITFTYGDRSRLYLPVPSETGFRSFMSVIASRRSRRELRGVPTDKLSALLWHAAKTRRSWVEPSGAIWQHKPVPSAGGRHPIDLLLIGGPPHLGMAVRYDSLAHALVGIDVPDPTALVALVEEVHTILPAASEATIVVFAAQIDKTLSKYECGESLVWRDAGAMDATMNLVAEALGLGYCALGTTGEPWLSQALNSAPFLYGVGGGVVGQP
jgi:SagB-type dehydrogenase family enzyme